MKRILCGCFAVLLAVAANGEQGLPGTNWAVELGSGDPAVRQTAEQAIMAMGKDAAASLEGLSKHPDPWVSARATRLLMELRGIDTRIPLRLQRAVLNYADLEDSQRVELLGELSNPGPGHLNALAFLYNRRTAGGALAEQESQLWRQRFRALIQAAPEEAETLRVEALNPAARAFMLTTFPETPVGGNAERYAKWRALDPVIRRYLTGKHVVMEVDHLKKNAGITELLEYIPAVIDPVARFETARLASEVLLNNPEFKAETLGATAAVGHLVTLVREGGIQKAEPWYGKHLDTHPGIAAKLPAELIPLETDRLLKAGALSSAIALLLKVSSDADPHARADWNVLRAIADKLGTKPESLPEGLPAIGDERSLPMMSGLLKAWFPMTRPSPGYADIEAKVVCFDRWAKTDGWLEAARRFGPHPLYHLIMSRRGKTGEALLLHEFERESDALKSLGSLILMRPSIAKEIPARQCSEATLRDILDGGFSGFRSDSLLPGPLLDLAAEWSGFHPELLAHGSFPTQPLYQAALAWRRGELEKAAAALLASAKPISTEPMPGQLPVPGARPNPLAPPAITLLANLLAESPNADLNLLLPPDAVSRETLQAMLDRLVRTEDRTPGQVHAAMAISRLLRDRFGVKDAKPLLSSREALSFALDAWLAGDGILAGDFLTQAYLSDPDPSERYDSILAPALRLLGRVEETLAELDDAEKSRAASVNQSKRARLLRELGHAKPAMDCVSPDHHPELRLRLAIETEAWDVAIRTALDVEDETKKREAMQVCIALVSGKAELMSRHTAGKHPVLNLLSGNGIREQDIAEMARDAELLSRLESRLTAALASGEPIRAIDMSAYFQHLDLLPDRNRAVLLAVELAKRDTCVFAYPSSGERYTGHKVLAAETLLLLGRGELAFAAVRPLMEASTEPHAFKGVANGVVTGGRIPAVVAGYRQATRLAQFEWPDVAAAERMDRLGSILGDKEPLTRARGMIGLISKHEAKLEKQDLLQAFQLVFLDLAHAEKVPEDLKDTARSLLLKRQPNQQEVRWLESQWTRVPWTDETRHRPSSGKFRTKVTFTPEPGSNSDPKSAGFVLIDGLSAASKLRKQGDAEGVRALLRDITMRLLLDPGMARQEAEWEVDVQGPDGLRSSRFGSRGFLAMLGYLDLLEVPSDLVSVFTDACANPWTNYSDARRLLHAARIMARTGDERAALAYHRRYLIATVPAFGSEDIGESGREEIAQMHRVRGMIAAREGDTATAVDALLRLVQIAPYVPGNARDIAVILAEKGDLKAMESAREAVEGFWRIRLLEIPSSETYRHWRMEWQSLFP